MEETEEPTFRDLTGGYSMSDDYTDATWVHTLRGKKIDIPATVQGISAALSSEDRALFEQALRSVHGRDMEFFLHKWAQKTEPDIERESEEIISRMEQGDYSDTMSPRQVELWKLAGEKKHN